MAIKVEELRSRNWIKSVNDGEAFALPSSELIYIADNPEGYSPIHITEEWLLKFGFGKCEEHALSKDIDDRLSIIYDWHFNMLYMVVTFPDGDELSHSFTHIEHVHELQNFWHSLSAEELIVQELTA